MNIKTLVPDIYKLFEGDVVNISDEKLDEFSKTLATKIKEELTKPPSEAPRLRMSNIGTKCKRRLWYLINTPKDAEKLSAPNKIKFLFGHIIEQLALFLAELAGHEVRGKQDELTVGNIKGSRDAVIDGVLVDVKSASSLSFDKFVEHLTPDTDAFGYLDQLGIYHQASDDVQTVQAAFLAVDKQLGKMHLDIHPRSKVNYVEKVEEVQQIISSDTIPPRHYSDVPDGKSGNRKLGVQCSYCEFKTKCWPNLRIYYYANGPRYLTEVKREPKVETEN